ncbi:hypothetical protein D9M71_390220 [compost metagenome]
MLAAYASQELYEVDLDSTHLQAGRELREWIKRRLIVEREGRIYATDALEVAIQFVESLDCQQGNAPAAPSHALGHRRPPARHGIQPGFAELGGTG